MAMANAKSATEIASSAVSGGMKMPRLCRMPMATVSMTEAAIRMGRAPGRPPARCNWASWGMD